MTRVDARAVARSVPPNSLATRARPVMLLSGSGSSTTSAGGGGATGAVAGGRFDPHPAATAATAMRGTSSLAGDIARRIPRRLRVDAHGDGRAADTDDGRGCFETD